MSGFSWWRSWHGAPTDHKWSVIAARSGVKTGIVSAVAWALFDYASQHPERGTVTGFDTEIYAVYSGFDETEIVAVIKAMNDKGVISNGYLANWKKRQPKREDDSRERVRKWREMKRSVTQCNAPDTDTDTDTDNRLTDTETEQPPPLFTLYEREIGAITPMIADELRLAIGEYPAEWFEDAIREAVAHNARRWKYILAILKRWKTDGRTSNGKAQAVTGWDAVLQAEREKLHGK